MAGGDHAPPPLPTRDDGAFILSLLQQPPSTSPAAAPPQYLAGDPAVAAVGPSLPFLPHIWPPQPQPPSATNGLDFLHDRFLGFQQNFPFPNQFMGCQPGTGTDRGDYLRSLSYQQPSISSNSSAPIQGYGQQNHRLMFGSLPSEIAVAPKGFSSRVDHKSTGQELSERNRPLNPNSGSNAPPGFPSRPRGGELGVLDQRDRMKPENYNLKRESVGYGDLIRAREVLGLEMGIREARSNGLPPWTQLDRTIHSVTVSEVEASMMKPESGSDGVGTTRVTAIDDVAQRLVGSLLIEEELDEKNEKKQQQISREKESRSDSRGTWILNQRRRIEKRSIRCRNDIERLNDGFLVIVTSLIPAEEEKFKQQHLLAQLQRLVSKEWPKARLCLYGSCANSFGVSRSDVDLCLAMEETDINKAEVLLKLADMLESDNLENVQALTRARVPIVKLQDPATGLSCDICINNVLAVENTKLLRDYARIDVRLQQLAYVVKHWAKSRGVNETYHGTLSSYAYVLMCIHYLQMRRPAILPCLQGMRPTYSVTVDTVECTYFDQIENLHNFGSHNKETIAQLVWGFFSYWAYVHDYTDSVISIRTGSIISKRDKDWTRRVGNDRHLICIEDPFETSHDLGRVVDKYSIRVLREEFERAAEIMQYDRNPCVKLFERYIPG